MPDIVKTDPATISWNWTEYGLAPARKETMWADYTKLFKMNDNSIYVPTANVNYVDNTTSKISWVKINCEKNTTDLLGYYEKSSISQTFSFTYPKGIALSPHMIILNHAVCGFLNEEGKRFYKILAIAKVSGENEKNPVISAYALSLDNIRKENIEGSKVTFQYHSYDPLTKKIFNTFSSTADCNNNLIFYENMTIKLDTLGGKPYLYNFNMVCSTRDKFANQTIESPQESNDKKLSLENAKEKCTSFGLKPKTEKFGVCVLELIK